VSEPSRPWVRSSAALAGLTLAALAFGGQRLAAQPVIEVGQTLPDAVALGAPVPVEVVVRNVGKDPAEDLLVSDVLPAGYHLCQATPPPKRLDAKLTWPVGRLGPGEQFVLRLCLEPTPDAARQPLRHAVEVVYQTRTASVRVAAVKAPQLVLNIDAAEACVPGTPAALRITIRNAGSAAAHDVTVQTLLAAGLSHPQGNDLESAVGSLEPGQERTLPLAVTPTRGGEVPVRVTARARGLDPVVRDVALHVADVRLLLQARGPAVLQQDLTGLFEVTVRNEDARAAGPVGLTVRLPPGLAFVRAGDQGLFDPPTRSIHWELGELRPAEQRTLAWNAVAQVLGVQEGKAQLHWGGRVCQEASWTTRVAPDSTSPPPAGPLLRGGE
jgi:uncharacterized repeat protein (TIGR01451 family)